ncbi:hypothetical protein QYE76_025550 [Lolium multiflorum]|uniref:Uncharacterized protein n=1 Tax=Lolium multiflorum TaxID=4521 RepID=A0AAD8REB1_LOLMU|nr:hypothetical protein QYE76_025550 [Lolium multiflorum]
MVKKKNPSAASSTTVVPPPNLPRFFRRRAPQALLPNSGAAAPPSSAARPGDWIASTVTKRDEKRSRSLGLISSDEGNVIFPAAEETRAPPKKRSIGGFADEDDLLDIDEAFAEPPPKRVRSDAVSPAAAASEASALKTAPAAQASTASSLSKGKDVPAAITAPPSGVISSLEAFASQFTSLEADKIRLQEEAKSSSSKLDGAIKKAAIACQEVDSLKEELNKLKERLKEEEARATEKDELLRQRSPPCTLDKIPSNSPANGVSMVLATHQLTRELLDKGKGALARMHSMIFPKAKQEKTLGQLIDAFEVDTKEVIEVFPVPSFVDDSSGVLPEGDRVQRMKDRITQMEKDLRSTYALAAIVNKKSEIAADVEHALTELHKATESLNCLLSIANATGDLDALYPKVLLPANIIVDKLEEDSRHRVARESSAAVVYNCHGSRVVPIAIPSIISSFIIPIVMSIGVSQLIVVVIAAIADPFAARVVLWLVVIFVIAARSSHVVLAISPVGDFH